MGEYKAEEGEEVEAGKCNLTSPVIYFCNSRDAAPPTVVSFLPCSALVST